jgi:hypothetical protein
METMGLLRTLLTAVAAWGGAAAARAEPCDRTIPVLEAGRETGRICPELAPAAGLTVVDLSDSWSPLMLRGTPYESTYVALANETPGEGHEWDRARSDRYLELYGIPPNLRVVSTRLLDTPRHICHALAGMGALAAEEGSLRMYQAGAPEYAPLLMALDQRLTCEGLLPVSSRPRPRWKLEQAMAAYQRKHTVVSRGILGPETRAALAEDSRELDFRAVLRVLRARVIDATGVIEDGTALAARGTILGRQVDGEAF